MSLRPAVSNNEDHIQGDVNATITLVEYGDYQCPHCGHAYPIIKEVQQKLGDQLKFVFRNFPLANIHPEATQAAIATEAAALQGKYWEMHDIVFENQKRLHYNAILEYANAVGLDIEQFEQDMQSEELSQKVEQHFESGVRSGVNGTPTFFINGDKYNGDWTTDLLADLEAI